MELRFDANQEHQLKAIDAIVDVFEGQPYIDGTPQSVLGLTPVVGNRLELDEQILLNNLHKVQERNEIDRNEMLAPIEQTNISTVDGLVDLRYHNFTVEMETGTGKTYVYIRTALELFKKYGFRKFVVVVPSIAIREGVLKTFQITKKHLSERYDNLPYTFFMYDSKNMSQVREFVFSDNLTFMVLTIDAFNKRDINIIRQSTDRFQGDIPIQLIQAVRPILILDEPQTKMEGERNILALGELCPLMALRYSATHRNLHNLVYRLTPFDAYHQHLVKQVEVSEVVESNDFNRAFIEVKKINSTPKTTTATLSVHKLTRMGVKERTVTVKPGNNLFTKTGSHEPYRDCVVTGIQYGAVSFAFGNAPLTLHEGQSTGEDRDEIHAAQIRNAIDIHFKKQAALEARNLKLKVLTLFFIDRVANYQDNGKLPRIFDKAFDELKHTSRLFCDRQPKDCRVAYFATRRSAGKDVWDDSSSGTAQKDRDAYDLIMRDKERLLSFDEQVSFIFSHSALNEGWDNPNVFQICTLRDVHAPIARRQQIGRGVRLPVNQDGERVQDEHVNVLTVIANENFSAFVRAYQQELDLVYGSRDAAPMPRNRRERTTILRTKAFDLCPDFKILWDKIKEKTRYSVKVSTERVIQDVVARLASDPPITAPQIAVRTHGLQFTDDHLLQGSLVAAQSTAIQRSLDLPDITRRIANLLASKQPPVSLSRSTILEIVRRSRRFKECMINPHAFATLVAAAITDKLSGHLVDGIKYKRINQWYEMTRFETEFDRWKDLLVPSTKSIYDHTEFDSDIESKFVEDMEARRDVRLYFKLPRWFKVPTPVGDYNPDWAIVMDGSGGQGSEKLYLVRETKGRVDDLRPSERHKIDYGRAHFTEALGVDYREVTQASELP
ncbi:MAG: DEAD/DEAH box helicase family protein [Chloroflexi bacterium]|nr:DEAD/DEAH box helicase family protein [Chloroflexota bacterium]